MGEPSSDAHVRPGQIFESVRKRASTNPGVPVATCWFRVVAVGPPIGGTPRVKVENVLSGKPSHVNLDRLLDTKVYRLVPHEEHA